MRLKSYFAETVEAALEQARRELGPEAMLVYSREALPEARYLGRYEVVLAQPTAEPGEPVPPPERRPEPAVEPARPADPETQVARLAREVAWLKGQIERMASAAAGTRRSRQRRLGSELREVLGRLEEAGLAPEIAEVLADRLQARPELDACLCAGEPGPLEALLRAELGSMFSTDARLGPDDASACAVALVGPPGSGKTTTLVKLAVACGLARRRPVKLVSADMWRLGAAEQLRSYAAILGVPFEAVETPGALAMTLEELRFKQLVLIDTPGYGSRDLEAMTELAALFAGRCDIDIHLTLSASMKPADLRVAVARYERLRPSKLLFTRVDETSSPGTIASEAIRTAMPVSFLSNGQQIPEDLLEASPDQILDLLFLAGTGIGEIGACGQERPDAMAAAEPRATGGRAAAA